MNPLLFANLGTQRRLLRSGTAYGMERVVVNVFCALQGFGGVLAVSFWWKLGSEIPAVVGVVPNQVIFAYRVLPVAAGLANLLLVLMGWALARAFLDMADASIAISLHGSGGRATAPVLTPGPRPSGGSEAWPEPPKPLIPTAEEPRPEERKYMPGGR